MVLVGKDTVLYDIMLEGSCLHWAREWLVDTRLAMSKGLDEYMYSDLIIVN